MAQLLEVLAKRRIPPRPWLDDQAPWQDPGFSRAWAETSSLGPGRARMEAAFLARLGGKAGKPRRAVDLGCGNGRTAHALARLGYRVLGIDLGPGAIAAAKARGPVRGLEFRVGNLLTDRLPEGPFDLAYAIDGTLAGFRPAQAAGILRRVRRASAPGAVLVLDLPSLAMAESLDQRQDWYVDARSPVGAFPQLVLTEDFFLRKARAYVHRAWSFDPRTGALAGWSQTYRIWSEAELGALLGRCGFRLEAVHGEFGPDAYAEGESLRLVAVARAA